MTARTAARRRGFAATGPPSWKISSMHVSFFRTTTSGMHQTSFLNAVGNQVRPVNSSHHACFSPEMKCSRPDQTNPEQALGSPRAGCERLMDFRCAQRADRLRDQKIFEI